MSDSGTSPIINVEKVTPPSLVERKDETIEGRIRSASKKISISPNCFCSLRRAGRKRFLNTIDPL